MMEVTEPDKLFVLIADGSGFRRLSRDILPLDERAQDKKSHMDTEPDTASHSTAV